MTARDYWQKEKADQHSENYRRLKRWGESRDRAAKKFKQEIDEGRAYIAAWQAEKELKELEGVFTQLGLKPEWAKLFAASNPEVEPTFEGIRNWTKEYGFPEPELQETSE